MFLASILNGIRDWWDRRAALADLRRAERDDEPYRMMKTLALVEEVKAAAFCVNKEGVLEAFTKLQRHSNDAAISSVTAIRGLLGVGLLDLAETVLQQGLQKYPDHPQLMPLYGAVSHHKRDWAEMARRFELLRQRFPDDVRGHLWRGVALRELGQFDESDSLLARAMAIEPQIPTHAMEYARVAEQRRDYSEALSRWRLVRERFEYLPGWVQYAAFLSRNGRTDDAVTLLTEARRRFDGKSEPAVELARISQSAGHLEDAAQQWANVREQFPHEEAAYIEGARALVGLGRQEEAETILQTYAERSGAKSGGLAEWARIVQKRDPRAAVLRWEIVRQKYPERDEGYAEGAKALEALGETDAAIRLLAQRPTLGQ